LQLIIIIITTIIIIIIILIAISEINYIKHRTDRNYVHKHAYLGSD
jgi:uncharacterized membrane protein YqiK